MAIIQDGGGNTTYLATVKPPNVAPVAGDTSLVVSLSPNSTTSALTNLTQVGGAPIALGQTTMANSLPVVIASNQSALPVTGTFFQATQPVSIAAAVAVTQSTSPWVISGTVTTSSFPTTVDTNYGTVGASTIRTAAQIGNAAGAAAFGAGSTSAQTLRVVVANDQIIPVSQSGTWTVQPGNTANTTPWLVTDSSDGSVTAGTAASKSSLAGGVFNTALPTLTTGQQVALQLDSSGRLIISPTTLPVTGTVTVSNLPTTVDTNFGTVGASTLRTASELGNATGAADFAAGNSSAQTLRVVIASNQVAIPVIQSVGTTGGTSTNVQQALTTKVNIKAAAGQLYGYALTNTNASTVYVFYYNTATTPATIGSATNLLFQIGIPAGASANVSFDNGIAFSTGIAVAVSTSATTSVAPTNGLVITTLYA
jgi:hypothetical protein